jgi:small nuclear ribonucleoprotein (snRNP)-like protein
MDFITSFLGQTVIVDLDDHYLVIGTLVEADPAHLAFTDADLHDHREANSTKEVYALESLRIGVRVNRARVTVPRHRLVAISLLADICV